MWPVRVSNPGPLTYESGALPTAFRGPTHLYDTIKIKSIVSDRLQEKALLDQEQSDQFYTVCHSVWVFRTHVERTV